MSVFSGLLTGQAWGDCSQFIDRTQGNTTQTAGTVFAIPSILFAWAGHCKRGFPLPDTDTGPGLVALDSAEREPGSTSDLG